MVQCVFPIVLEQPTLLVEPINPCQPSPCGSNAICRVQSNRPVCSCVANYIGRPPNCRPECIVNSECSMNLACVNEKCINPCQGSCGPNAECRVVSHKPMCTCYPDYTGDPFFGCNKIQSKLNVEKNRALSRSSIHYKSFLNSIFYLLF